MYPTLFRIGSFHVATYGVVVALAVLTAGWLAARAFEERALDRDRAWSLVIYGLIGGFVGAKLYYVVLQGDFGAILSRAGLVWYGGLIGGIVAVAFRIRQMHLPLGVTADGLAPSLAIGHGIGHIGCFFSGDSYGVPSNLPWAVAFPRGTPPSTAGALRTEFGVTIPSSVPDSTLIAVHPTMLYSALALIVVFAILWGFRHRHEPAGWLFGLYLVLTGVERFLVEFVRAKDDRFLWGFTTAQAVAAAAIIGGTLLLLTLRSRASRTPRPAVVSAH